MVWGSAPGVVILLRAIIVLAMIHYVSAYAISATAKVDHLQQRSQTDLPGPARCPPNEEAGGRWGENPAPLREGRKLSITHVG
jgi:hypothetical protein